MSKKSLVKEMIVKLNESDIERILLGMQILRCFLKYKSVEGMSLQKLSVTYNKLRRQFLNQRRQDKE